MAPLVRKAALMVHVITSVGWIGAVIGFLVLAVAGLTEPKAPRAGGVYVAMDLLTRFAVLPFAVGALLSGVVMSLGTHWGLIRYYWVVFKLLITSLATVVLLLQLRPIGYLADVSAGAAPDDAADIGGMRNSLVVHAGGGLLVLLLPMVLSVYKPKGITRYGVRRLQTAGRGK